MLERPTKSTRNAKSIRGSLVGALLLCHELSYCCHQRNATKPLEAQT
jgi:hypothetical protein